MALSDSDILACGRDTLALQRDGLEALAQSLGGAFVEAVRTLLAMQGRCVVCGLGKSGHVGRKIAATFASTGTPSFFVHATEASHGDFGMITQEDLALVLSFSGESAELANVIAYCRRYGIHLIAITGRPKSSLAEAADTALIVPDIGEAPPLRMAPTTSTTLTMAMGDALAMALVAARGFDAQDFSRFHPGGKLGAQMLTVDEVSRRSGHDLPLVKDDALMADVVMTMTIGAALNSLRLWNTSLAFHHHPILPNQSPLYFSFCLRNDDDDCLSPSSPPPTPEIQRKKNPYYQCLPLPRPLLLLLLHHQ